MITWIDFIQNFLFIVGISCNFGIIVFDLQCLACSQRESSGKLSDDIFGLVLTSVQFGQYLAVGTRWTPRCFKGLQVI